MPPLWEALHNAGFPHSEVRRVVHTFTRKINADMKAVVGNKVLYQWEQDMEAFLKDKEDPGVQTAKPKGHSDRGHRGDHSRSNPRDGSARNEQSRRQGAGGKKQVPRTNKRRMGGRS